MVEIFFPSYAEENIEYLNVKENNGSRLVIWTHKTNTSRRLDMQISLQ